MTPEQQTAISDPCYFGFETAQNKFRSLILGGRASLIVTVNNGYE